jgi:hypothetical protein
VNKDSYIGYKTLIHLQPENRDPLAVPNVDMATTIGTSQTTAGITLSAHVYNKRTMNIHINANAPPSTWGAAV